MATPRWSWEFKLGMGLSSPDLWWPCQESLLLHSKPQFPQNTVEEGEVGDRNPGEIMDLPKVTRPAGGWGYLGTGLKSLLSTFLSSSAPPPHFLSTTSSASVEVAASPSLLQTLAISCESDSVLNLYPLLLEPLVDPNTRRRGSAVGRGGPELQWEREGIAVVVGRTNRRKSFCSPFKMLPLPGSHP